MEGALALLPLLGGVSALHSLLGGASALLSSGWSFSSASFGDRNFSSASLSGWGFQVCTPQVGVVFAAVLSDLGGIFPSGLMFINVFIWAKLSCWKFILIVEANKS